MSHKKVDSEIGDDATDLGCLSQYLGYALRRAQVAIFDDFIETLAELDLRPGQFSALAVIEANPGITPSRIGIALGIKPANCVPLVREFETRGLTRRVAIDRRSSGLHLTARGRALVRKADQLGQRHKERITQQLRPGEFALLVDALFRLALVRAPKDE